MVTRFLAKMVKLDVKLLAMIVTSWVRVARLVGRYVGRWVARLVARMVARLVTR